MKTNFRDRAEAAAGNPEKTERVNGEKKMLRNKGTKRRNGAGLVFALVILFVALLVSASGISFAKNLSSSTGGDNAQVSALIIDLRVSSSDNLAIDCGQEIMTAEYHFTVTNTKDGKTSEIPFKYDVIVTLPEALQGVSITLNETSGTASSDGKTVTFTGVGRFAAGNSQTHNHSLFFNAADGSLMLQDRVYENISVSVRAEQVC